MASARRVTGLNQAMKRLLLMTISQSIGDAGTG
jgi:hypothetical protein